MVSAATTTPTRGDTRRYAEGRERVLGRRALVPEDIDGAAAVLAALHGGERRAAAWLRQVLRSLEGRAS
jgi:hypothetical protein